MKRKRSGNESAWKKRKRIIKADKWKLLSKRMTFALASHSSRLLPALLFRCLSFQVLFLSILIASIHFLRLIFCYCFTIIFFVHTNIFISMAFDNFGSSFLRRLLFVFSHALQSTHQINNWKKERKKRRSKSQLPNGENNRIIVSSGSVHKRNNFILFRRSDDTLPSTAQRPCPVMRHETNVRTWEWVVSLESAYLEMLPFATENASRLLTYFHNFYDANDCRQRYENRSKMTILGWECHWHVKAGQQHVVNIFLHILLMFCGQSIYHHIIISLRRIVLNISVFAASFFTLEKFQIGENWMRKNVNSIWPNRSKCEHFIRFLFFVRCVSLCHLSVSCIFLIRIDFVCLLDHF